MFSVIIEQLGQIVNFGFQARTLPVNPAKIGKRFVIYIFCYTSENTYFCLKTISQFDMLLAAGV